MEWKTRVTELLGCKYPILQGPLARFGTWEFAAAVSKTGAQGCLTASVSRTPERLREHIQKLRREVRNFTVNISIGMCPHVRGMFEVCVDESVPALETSVYRPDDYIDLIKRAQGRGTVWIHKGATLQHIKHAERLGADAVVIFGRDGFGFKSIQQLPTFSAIAWAAKNVKIPLIAAGGIGNARTFLGALALGAEGVEIGTAFLATRESPLPEAIKANIVRAQPDHPELIRDLMLPPEPEEYRAIMEAREKVPFERWLIALEMVQMGYRDWRRILQLQDVDVEKILEQEIREAQPSPEARPRGPYSFACGYIDRIPTCQELVDEIIRGAEEILKEWVQRFRLA